MKLALTIAGSDSSGGAGIQADLKVFADLGLYGVSAVTAVTAQDSHGVRKVNTVPPRIVAAQIDASARDFEVDACKIGMLYSPEVVSIVVERIGRREIPNVVLDPVIFAKNGERLFLSRAVYRMRRFLIPKCRLITPNVVEAELLTKRKVTDIASAKDAAKAIRDLGADSVLIKGGHLEGEPVDILFDGKEFIEYPGKRIAEKNMHGTGCVLSAAIAARLALGDSVAEAVRFAKEYIESAIRNSVRLGKGGLWYFAGAHDINGINHSPAGNEQGVIS